MHFQLVSMKWPAADGPRRAVLRAKAMMSVYVQGLARKLAGKAGSNGPWEAARALHDYRK